MYRSEQTYSRWKHCQNNLRVRTGYPRKMIFLCKKFYPVVKPAKNSLHFSIDRNNQYSDHAFEASLNNWQDHLSPYTNPQSQCSEIRTTVFWAIETDLAQTDYYQLHCGRA